jgi:HSP20 family protein
MATALAKRSANQQPLARLQDEFESLFDRVLGGLPTPFDDDELLDERMWGLDIEERDNEVVVRADVPGFEPDELDVQLTGRLLTVKAEHEQTKEEKDAKRVERSFRSFYRTVSLPEDVKSDQVQAKYKNGVLEIHVPKSEGARPKRIAIET